MSKKETIYEYFVKDYAKYMKEQGFVFAGRNGIKNKYTGEYKNTWKTLREFEKLLGINYKSEIMGRDDYEGTLNKIYASKT